MSWRDLKPQELAGYLYSYVYHLRNEMYSRGVFSEAMLSYKD